MDAADLKDRFYYCETSSTGLRFNKDLVRGKGKGYVYKKKGEEAGTPMFMRDKIVRILNINGTGYTERHGVESEEKAQDNYHCI